MSEKSFQEYGAEAPHGQRPDVYIVEHDATARDGVVTILEQRGFRCHAFATAEEFLAAGAPTRPCCLVLDYQLPGISGLELQERLAERAQVLPIVVITGHVDVPAAVRFMERGATTLLEKPFQPDQLSAAIARSVELDRVNRRVRERFEKIGAAVEQLSAREKTVLQAIVNGQLNKAIARALDVSVRTIEGDRAKIVDKFGAETTGEVVGKYAQYSLLTEMGYNAGDPPRDHT